MHNPDPKGRAGAGRAPRGAPKQVRGEASGARRGAPDHYSAWKASTGSIRVALLAGTRQAATPTATNSAVTVP